jgi:hypothetical protein
MANLFLSVIQNILHDISVFWSSMRFFSHISSFLVMFCFPYLSISIHILYTFGLDSIYLWVYTPLGDLGRYFSFLICSQSLGPLRRGFSPSQGPYLHTEQNNYRINAHRHSCLEWDSNQWSQYWSGRRQIMPQIARSLWSTWFSLSKLYYHTGDKFMIKVKISQLQAMEAHRVARG